jgi:hypothetical protein
VAQTESQDAYFTAREDELIPAPHARSWWSAEMLHGRLLGGLMARAVEAQHGTEELHFTRFTVDLFRNAALEPVRVTTERVRDGRRIRVVDAAVHSSGRAIARASALLLRRTEQPSGRVPSTPPWDAPPMEEFPAPAGSLLPMRLFDAENRPMGMWSEAGEGPRRVWLRETRPLVAGESLSPFVRAALAADTASPLVHAGADGLEFINADYTLCLSRLPLSEAIGMQSGGHTSEDGVAVGHCTLHDATGPIGYCATTAVANRK